MMEKIIGNKVYKPAIREPMIYTNFMSRNLWVQNSELRILFDNITDT